MMFLEVCAIFLVALWMWNRHKTSRERELIARFPGPTAYPIIGNVTKLRASTVEFFDDSIIVNAEFAKYGQPFRVLIGTQPVVVLNDPKDYEVLLGSNKQLDKGEQYQFVLPWLGTGLLTSTGTKWRSHRKILTPTFHFKILEEFLDVFNANGEVLVQKLKAQENKPGFDIYNYITMCALDNICGNEFVDLLETAMGVKVNAQNDRESEYVNAIRDESNVIMIRSIVKPWLRLSFLFNLSKYKKIHDKSLDILHRTTRNVIKKRRAELTRERENNMTAPSLQSEITFGAKKRLAFLDLLIETTLNGSNLTDEEIREEVDTFMFEGHDTTSSAISFALWLLSWHEDIQDKVYQELQEVFPDPKETESFRGLSDLKYMEKVIKETLRLYPSVPFYFRQVNEEVKLSGGLIIPNGVSVCMHIFTSHRNPTFWPDPLKFDPERFSPDNIQGRNPYAFVPFSAGPRNCIGQKFAMLEIKSALSHVLRSFKILPGTPEPDLILANEMILVSKNGIKVKIVPRT